MAAPLASDVLIFSFPNIFSKVYSAFFLDADTRALHRAVWLDGAIAIAIAIYIYVFIYIYICGESNN